MNSFQSCNPASDLASWPAMCSGCQVLACKWGSLVIARQCSGGPERKLFAPNLAWNKIVARRAHDDIILICFGSLPARLACHTRKNPRGPPFFEKFVHKNRFFEALQAWAPSRLLIVASNKWMLWHWRERRLRKAFGFERSRCSGVIKSACFQASNEDGRSVSEQ
jgi:hypothetical protein